MKRPLAITSLLFILMAYVESLDVSMDKYEDEVYQCFVKLLCPMNKVEEIYNVTSDLGPKNIEKYREVMKKVIDVEFPEFTLEHCTTVKEIFCKWPEERKKKAFFEINTEFGELYLVVCQHPDSEECIKADTVIGEFASTIAKYKATGDCPISETVPVGMDKIGSSRFG